MAASKLVSARIARAERWRHAVADAYANEGAAEWARRVRSQRINPARLARWLRSLVAAYTDDSPDLMHGRGVTGAAVLGFDPAETPHSIPR